jgi:hypothetical protein
MGNPASGAAGAANPNDVQVRPVQVDASAIVADRERRRVYAVVLGKAAEHGNELVVIDADQATIEASVVVGSDPGSLAISDDASRVWVGLRGALSIREVDLTEWPPRPGAQYALHSNFGNFPGRMLVLPGAPESVAISLRYEHGVVTSTVVLDAGTPRPSQLDSFPGAPKLIIGPPGYLFGFNDENTGFDFLSIAVDSDGLTRTFRDGLVDGFGTDIAYDEGLVVASSGQVVDVSEPESPVRAGTFAHKGLVVPHVADSTVMMLSYAQGPPVGSELSDLVVRQLNLRTFLQDDEHRVPGKYARIHDLYEIGAGRYAFIESPGTLSANPNSPSRVQLLWAP